MCRGRRWGAGARLWGSAWGKAQAAGGPVVPGTTRVNTGDDAVPPRVPRSSGGTCARRDCGGNDHTGVRQSHGGETITRGRGGHTGRDGHTGGRRRDGHAAADNTAARGRRALGQSTAHDRRAAGCWVMTWRLVAIGWAPAAPGERSMGVWGPCG